MARWLAGLRGDPRPWLLDEADPAVRHLALRWLEDRPADDPAVQAARGAAMRTAPIATILDAQSPDGWWVKPGPGYGPKYTGTTWSLIFLDQLGADGDDDRIRRACAYLLDHVPTSDGGLGMSGSATLRPPPSSVVHCLNGNLVRALVGFGWLDDPRVAAAIDWQARSILGGPEAPTYHRTATSGPGFGCGVNERLPCAWGATKALLGLARIPEHRQSPATVAAIDASVEFLLSVDPATAAYPAGWEGRISGSWFKPGFPSGYVADVVQVLEALADVGRAADPRTGHAIEWLLAKQDADGRWRNEYPYAGKLWADIDRKGVASKWVTLRAVRVVRAALA
ncbi:MAG TPA: hypothetical protein VFX65_11255 [Candidatus Limnocylindrales bacterium]|nr:hypothetical protein [Candidatus Limnocylindrales bacterium]